MLHNSWNGEFKVDPFSFQHVARSSRRHSASELSSGAYTSFENQMISFRHLVIHIIGALESRQSPAGESID